MKARSTSGKRKGEEREGRQPGTESKTVEEETREIGGDLLSCLGGSRVAARVAGWAQRFGSDHSLGATWPNSKQKANLMDTYAGQDVVG